MIVFGTCFVLLQKFAMPEAKQHKANFTQICCWCELSYSRSKRHHPDNFC